MKGHDDVWFSSREAWLVAAAGGHLEAYDERFWRVAQKEGEETEEKGIALGSGVVLPELPCRRIQVIKSTATSSIPASLSDPLVKCKRGEKRALAARASGVRSALVRVEDAWYRLKGCGNHDAPFAKVQLDTTSFQVRGSAFVETARREVFLTATMRIPGASCANYGPVGIWRYSRRVACGELAPLACSVTKTRGDRRLGTHVLSGLCLLLDELLQIPSDTTEASLAALFPSHRPDGLKISTSELCTDAMIAFELMDLESYGIEWPQVKRDTDLFADLTSSKTNVGVFIQTVPKTPPEKQWTRSGEKPFDPEWTAVWNSAISNLSAVYTSSPSTLVLAYLFSRIGAEAGLMLRGLHELGFSWGTYSDKLCHDGQLHCNAHPNNLVMLSPDQSKAAYTQMQNQKSRQILGGGPPLTAFLDLDMAFDRSSLKDDITSSDFARLLLREKYNFAEVLAGGDASSGVNQFALRHIEKVQSPGKRAISHALFDTMLAAFFRSYDSIDADECSRNMIYDPILHRGAYALIQLAIITTADYLA